MDNRKLSPWNWFAKEDEEAGRTAHARHTGLHEWDDFQQSPFHPFHLFHRFHQDMDRLLSNVFRGAGSDRQIIPAGIFKPTVDIHADENAYTITVEVPGVDEKDVSLELADETLIIRGEKKQEKEEKTGNFYRVERAYGCFQRILSLPADADQENIDADFGRGVLCITVPRKPRQQSNVRRIKVKSVE